MLDFLFELLATALEVFSYFFIIFYSILVDKAGLRAELDLAVHCCSLTEVLITATNRLWLVPDNLIAQLRSINESHHKENKPVSKPQFYYCYEELK